MVAKSVSLNRITKMVFIQFLLEWWNVFTDSVDEKPKAKVPLLFALLRNWNIILDSDCYKNYHILSKSIVYS